MSKRGAPPPDDDVVNLLRSGPELLAARRKDASGENDERAFFHLRQRSRALRKRGTRCWSPGRRAGVSGRRRKIRMRRRVIPGRARVWTTADVFVLSSAVRRPRPTPDAAAALMRFHVGSGASWPYRSTLLLLARRTTFVAGKVVSTVFTCSFRRLVYICQSQTL